MLDQYSGKRPYEGYPKALQDGIAIINTLSADLTQSQAEVAAAYERAAEVCTNIIKNYDCMKADGKTYQPMWVQKVAKGMVSIARQDIRALATTEQTAALDTIRAEARAQGMREAAYIAFNACLVLPDGGNPTEEERLVCDEAYNRILAAITKGAKA